MQQRAAVQPTSRFEPIVENYVNFLRVTCERLGIIFTPALEEEVRRKLRQKVESEKEDPLSSAALFQRCVMVTLEALREAKKQSGDKVVVDEETARSAEAANKVDNLASVVIPVAGDASARGGAAFKRISAPGNC
jgi:hypothetical protein